jgi:hypothetical protein
MKLKKLINESGNVHDSVTDSIHKFYSAYRQAGNPDKIAWNELQREIQKALSSLHRE